LDAGQIGATFVVRLICRFFRGGCSICGLFQFRLFFELYASQSILLRESGTSSQVCELVNYVNIYSYGLVTYVNIYSYGSSCELDINTRRENKRKEN
jgi:hypothetical protein